MPPRRAPGRPELEPEGHHRRLAHDVHADTLIPYVPAIALWALGTSFGFFLVFGYTAWFSVPARVGKIRHEYVGTSAGLMMTLAAVRGFYRRRNHPFPGKGADMCCATLVMGADLLLRGREAGLARCVRDSVPISRTEPRLPNLQKSLTSGGGGSPLPAGRFP